MATTEKARGIGSSFADAWLIDGVRTLFADYNGAFAPVSPIDLGIKAAREVFKKTKASPADVGTVIAGSMAQASFDAYMLPRHVGLYAGVPQETPAHMVQPEIMGIGPVPAIQALLEKTGLSMDDFDLVELNEAFAPQVLAVLRDVPIAADRLNVNGGAIALGHPIGATGARILVTLVHEMKRRGAKRGMATLCVSGGLGMALAVERA